jgi:acyl-CoA synthetase (AMP-forming)/AMP-acid ligase II
MAAQTIIDLMDARASQTGPFLISPDTGIELSFQRFRDEAHRVAKQIVAQGIQPGDRVAIAIPNGIEVLLAFFGATEAGAMAMPLNPDLKPDEYDFALEHSGARLTICVPSTVDRVKAKAGTGKRQDSIVGISFSAADGIRLEGGKSGGKSVKKAPSADDEALLLYTSGTTSAPKGVEISHRNLTVSAKNVADWYNLSERDVTACVMPLFHVHGLVASVLASLRSGGTVVVPQRFSASNFWSIVRAYGVSWYTAVPTIHTILLNNALKSGDTRDAAGLRFVRSCSAALSPATMEAYEATFGAPILQAFGMTEAAHQALSNPLPRRERKPGSIGLPTGVGVTILDDDGNELPPGKEGELALKGANVTKGYLNNPEATRDAFTNGWFRTGDLARTDEDGYVSLLGRIKELINRGGEKISPLEVDDVLAAHPKIAEAVTVAVPHDIYGEEVEAVVALKPGESADAPEIISFCREQLADFKVPKAIRFVPSIPRSATGKIQRRRLLELL